MNSCGVLLQFEASQKYFWVYVDRKNRKLTAIHSMSVPEVRKKDEKQLWDSVERVKPQGFARLTPA